MTKDAMLPGEHPHSDRPNWRPAETLDEYLSNCQEGLEQYTYDRDYKLIGMNRMEGWRCRKWNQLPPDLIDYLLSQRKVKLSSRGLAQIAQFFERGGKNFAEVQCCPNCGYKLRTRYLVPPKVMDLLSEWTEQKTKVIAD